VPSIWLDLANADCFCKIFLQYLGQWKLPPELRTSVDKETCCNACNSSLVRDMPAAPVPDTVKLRKPSDGSMAAIALQLIDQWAVTKANLKYAYAGALYEMPADAFMDEECRWQLAYLFPGKTDPIEDMSRLQEKVESIQRWRWVADPVECESLLSFLRGLQEHVVRKWTKQRQDWATHGASTAATKDTGDEDGLDQMPERERDNRIALRVSCNTLRIAIANRQAAASRPPAAIPVPATPRFILRRSIASPSIRHAGPASVGIGPSNTTPIPVGLADHVAQLVKTPQQQSGYTDFPLGTPDTLISSARMLEKVRKQINSLRGVGGQGRRVGGLSGDSVDIIPDAPIKRRRTGE
jgi:hypothetical protein